MKRYSFWIIVSLITFSIGVGVVVAWVYFDQKEIVEVEPVPLVDNSCVKTKSFPGLSRNISELKKGKSGFFPKATWKGYDTGDHFMNGWYGDFLKTMDNYSLLDVSGEREAYRFLWLRTFHHPIAVRVERKYSSIQLFFTEFDGAGGYNPGKLLISKYLNLTEEQWCEFLSLLEKSSYWRMSAEDNELLGVDGARWIMEGVKDSRYHVVDRFSPETGEYREACIYLLKLSGVDVDGLKDDLY